MGTETLVKTASITTADVEVANIVAEKEEHLRQLVNRHVMLARKMAEGKAEAERISSERKKLQERYDNCRSALREALVDWPGHVYAGDKARASLDRPKLIINAVHNIEALREVSAASTKLTLSITVSGEAYRRVRRILDRLTAFFKRTRLTHILTEETKPIEEAVVALYQAGTLPDGAVDLVETRSLRVI